MPVTDGGVFTPRSSPARADRYGEKSRTESWDRSAPGDGARRGSETIRSSNTRNSTDSLKNVRRLDSGQISSILKSQHDSLGPGSEAAASFRTMLANNLRLRDTMTIARLAEQQMAGADLGILSEADLEKYLISKEFSWTFNASEYASMRRDLFSLFKETSTKAPSEGAGLSLNKQLDIRDKILTKSGRAIDDMLAGLSERLPSDAGAKTEGGGLASALSSWLRAPLVPRNREGRLKRDDASGIDSAAGSASGPEPVDPLDASGGGRGGGEGGTSPQNGETEDGGVDGSGETTGLDQDLSGATASAPTNRPPATEEVKGEESADPSPGPAAQDPKMDQALLTLPPVRPLGSTPTTQESEETEGTEKNQVPSTEALGGPSEPSKWSPVSGTERIRSGEAGEDSEEGEKVGLTLPTDGPDDHPDAPEAPTVPDAEKAEDESAEKGPKADQVRLANVSSESGDFVTAPDAQPTPIAQKGAENTEEDSGEDQPPDESGKLADEPGASKTQVAQETEDGPREPVVSESKDASPTAGVPPLAGPSLFPTSRRVHPEGRSMSSGFSIGACDEIWDMWSALEDNDDFLSAILPILLSLLQSVDFFLGQLGRKLFCRSRLLENMTTAVSALGGIEQKAKVQASDLASDYDASVRAMAVSDYSSCINALETKLKSSAFPIDLTQSTFTDFSGESVNVWEFITATHAIVLPSEYGGGKSVTSGDLESIINRVKKFSASSVIDLHHGDYYFVDHSGNRVQVWSFLTSHGVVDPGAFSGGTSLSQNDLRTLANAVKKSGQNIIPVWDLTIETLRFKDGTTQNFWDWLVDNGMVNPGSTVDYGNGRRVPVQTVRDILAQKEMELNSINSIDLAHLQQAQGKRETMLNLISAVLRTEFRDIYAHIIQSI